MKLNKWTNGLVLLTCGFLVVSVFSGSALADNKEKYEEKFVKTEKLDKDSKVYVNNLSGKIEVKTWAQNEVKIDALKVSKASTLARAEENAKKVNIEVNRVGNTLRIESKYPEHKSRKQDSLNVSVHYNLWIPDKASFEAKSVSGNLSAEGIGGTFEVNIVSGNVSVVKAEKGVDCKTISGSIEIQEITGDVFLKSVSGTIEVSRIKGSIDAETTSGRIRLEDVDEAKVVKAKVLSGGVHYQGRVIPGGRYSLESLSGSVKVILPQDSSFEFEAETFSGHIETDFPVEATGKISPRELRGMVNKGGAVLRLKTFSGNIYLKKS
ncbi:MAG: DUF4097 family beta strand repeat-containing protein [Candidatus Aminicenantales bacterium]